MSNIRYVVVNGGIQTDVSEESIAQTLRNAFSEHPSSVNLPLRGFTKGVVKIQQLSLADRAKLCDSAGKTLTIQIDG